MEPEALECVASLADGQLEERHFAGAKKYRTAHLGDYAGGFARIQFIETAGVLTVLVAERKMVEQILRCMNVAGLKHLLDLRTHARNKL